MNKIIKIVFLVLFMIVFYIASYCYALDKPKIKSINPNYTDPKTGMKFIFIKGGSFQMGGLIKSVRDFYMGKYEVTQGQWKKVMGDNPSYFNNCGDNCPVEQLTWNDAQLFIAKLNSQTDGKYRLPEEAEWEYACRSGGKNETYSGGEDVDSVAWYAKNSGNRTHQAGTKSPNGLGIYDMSGNVWEWTQDNWDTSDSGRVVRGGCWYCLNQYTRCSYRTYYLPDIPYYPVGFRLLKIP